VTDTFVGLAGILAIALFVADKSRGKKFRVFDTEFVFPLMTKAYFA
jgi:hypothetical protein